GSQVFYADKPVTLAQNTTLSAVRTITLVNTGPGVSGAPGTGVVNRISGNLSGPGAPRFTAANTPQGPAGQGLNEVAELVLAGSTIDTGTPGAATLQNANVFIINASNNGATANPQPTDVNPSGQQTMQLLVRDGTLSLGSGSNPVTFQYGTEAFFNNANLFAGDGVLYQLGPFGLADGQGGASQRTVEKVGTGTAILNNVTYA